RRLGGCAVAARLRRIPGAPLVAGFAGPGAVAPRGAEALARRGVGDAHAGALGAGA
ncbi:unnamed protein product, partial [Effrenium voratum]